MELQEFVTKTAEALKKYYDSKVKVETHQIYKNNGILLHSVCVLNPGKNIAPTVYLNDFFELYQSGVPFAQIFQNIVELIEKNQLTKNLDVDFFLDYQQVKKRLVYRLVQQKRNQELLKEVPYIPFHDLAIVCHCLIVNELIGTGSILIHHQHLESWGITPEELFQDAEENSPKLEPYSVISMSEIIRDIMRKPVEEQVEEICREYPQDKEKMVGRTLDDMVKEIDEFHIRMSVLTNASRYYGAACLVYPGILEQIGEKMGKDYYILPSSVHEVILLPKTEDMEQAYLNGMIREINIMQVEQEEWLSDHAYLYQREEKRLLPLQD